MAVYATNTHEKLILFSRYMLGGRYGSSSHLYTNETLTAF